MKKSIVAHAAEKGPPWTALLIAAIAAFQVWAESEKRNSIVDGGVGNSKQIEELGKRLDAQHDLIMILVEDRVKTVYELPPDPEARPESFVPGIIPGADLALEQIQGFVQRFEAEPGKETAQEEEFYKKAAQNRTSFEKARKK